MTKRIRKKEKYVVCRTTNLSSLNDDVFKWRRFDVYVLAPNNFSSFNRTAKERWQRQERDAIQQILSGSWIPYQAYHLMAKKVDALLECVLELEEQPTPK